MTKFYNSLTKKALLSLLIVLFSMAGFSATYYVSNTGNDANSGLSTTLAWKSLTKVNAVSLMPGDQILFQRGNTFYGTLSVKNSGSSSAPIVYGAYGTGNNPIITGFTTITGWVSEGGGIYSKSITSEAATNMVSIDGVSVGMGRYPNDTYLTFESCNTNVSITDDQLGSSSIWTGAEAVIRKNDWSLDRCSITSHSGNTLTYKSLGTGWNAKAGNGYFIQNDLRTLDKFGEWYHNASTGKFYMYFGTIDPNTKTVNVGTINYLVNNSSAKYITIENLSLVGCINNGIQIGSSVCNNVTIRNNTISFVGATGINTGSSYMTFTNNVMNYCHSNGIVATAGNVNILNNTITNIGIIKGASKYYSQGIFAKNVDNLLIQYNKIENVGYNGVFINGNNVTVKNNYINNICLTLNDGGGIYTDDTAPTAMVIDGNIISNAVGNMDGGETPLKIAEGIYLDELANGVIVQNNTVFNCAYAGIKLHKASNNTIQNNTSYGNFAGIYFLNSSTTSSTLANNKILSNILVSTNWDHYCWFIRDVFNTSAVYGTSNNNYYIKKPSDPYNHILTSLKSVGSAYRTLAQWQAYTGQDVNSHEAPQKIANISDLMLEYNATQSVKTVALSQPMIDMKGVKYSGTITLQPYTSIVLMKDYSVTTVSPIVYNVTGGGSYVSGGTGVAIGLSGSQIGVNYQLKRDGVNDGNVVSGTGGTLSFGNKTVAGVYTVLAMLVSSGTSANMTGSATVSINSSSIAVTGVSVNLTSATILAGSTQQLTATVLPSNATNKTATWSSSNTSVATVNSVGLVTGIASGSATITVRTQDGSKTATSSINVSSSNTGSSGVVLGLNAVGSSSESGINGNWIASSFTPTSNMTVNRMNLYAGQASGTVRMAIYTSNSAGEPAALLAQTGDISLITGWNSGTLGSSQNLVAGATYWLAFEVSSSLTQVRYNSSYGKSRYKPFAYGPFPSSAPISNVGGGIYSIYADNNGVKSGIINGGEVVTGIEDLSQQTKIDVFPNPSKGNITVRFSTLPEVDSRIEITDISGRIITSQIVSSNDEMFNLDQQPNGIYLVKSIIGSSITVQKLIINK